MSAHVIEHGSTRPGRWLRERRLRITFWIAAIEGLLYVVHILHWWEAVGLAAIGLLLWLFVGSSSRSDLVRNVTWIFAASQLLVLCVPLALAVVKAVAIAVIALMAIIGLILLFNRRP